MKETDRGISLDPMEASKEAIRRNVEIAMDWPYRKMATTLYRWADIFRERLLDPVAIPGRGRMPDIVLSFEPMNYRALAGYTLQRNAQGLLNEIAFNSKRLDRPLWEHLETLLHEMVHLWQQNFGQHPIRRAYHKLQFLLDRWFGENASFLLGVIYVVLVLFVPYGIVGTWRLRRLEGKQGWQRLLRLLGLRKGE